jgi:hypothetical protein
MDKLLEFQKKVGALKKDSTNPYYKSKYVDINSLLDTVKPVLNQIGLTVIQPLEVKDGKNILTTKVYDGAILISESAIIIPDNIDPQKIGSAITYYRRYSLQSLFLLEAEDDDAESAKPQKKAEVWQKNNAPKIITTNEEAKEMFKPNGLDPKIVDVIAHAKTVKELNDIYTGLPDDDKPNYLDKLATRKAILKANKEVKK